MSEYETDFQAELQQENDRLTSSGNRNFLQNFVNMPKESGAVVVRLFPPAKQGAFNREKNHLYCLTRIHKVNGKSLHCLRVLTNDRWMGNCPVCEFYNKLWNDSKKMNQMEAEKLQAQAREIKPIERYYYNVLVRQQLNEQTQEVEKNVGPKILSVGKTLHAMIIKAFTGNKELDEKPLGNVADPKAGRDFKIIKEIKKSSAPGQSYPSYNSSKFLEPSPLGSMDEIGKWMGNLHDLAALKFLKPAEEMSHELAIHRGLIPSEGTSYNPTDFQKTSVAATVVSTEEDGDASLSDDDFMSELRKTISK
jgi:hypothetical protein